ncbi:manganese-dependent inorganic pyrophosphatase [Marinilactibacillus sp. 15R]|uniref:manganese-dependent inorganic pyrophosphatase n=1 Tax=Marinilactibacillus sp. 15R TaxID=1911586 RepID=UPI0009096CC4|nr:manganese-dependent inorganic pyrophosphatase [Marinilactibacillus sp. 15R]API89497.1 manganese-dependent inorganic pyrophosphatase [Marinilactibacillus sp. 15R]
MDKILVFGHKSPDTDAVTSAISFSYLQNQLGLDTEAVALGELGEETTFALDYFNVSKPRVVSTVANEVKQVMLVDHNESQQSVGDIEKVEVLSVVDHHRIANFQTANPLYYRAEPVGCTNTIILKLYKEHGITVPKDIAGIMLSAIISDTLLLKSPTCTEIDVDSAKELAAIAEVDLESYGVELLKAGTKTKNKSAENLLDADAKSFPMNEKTVRIGQVNVVDVNEILARKEELLEAMKVQSEIQGYDLFILLITNVLENDSTAIIYGNPVEEVSDALNSTIKDNVMFLEGVVSRKKQVVPQLTLQFEN